MSIILNPKLFNTDIEQVPSRNGFGEGLVIAARADARIVALCADLTESTRIQAFKDEFPDRFVEIGVAEQNLAAVASGMAAAGKRPVISSYATFSPGRNWEQIRTTICYNDQPVTIVGSHAGISVGPDGATHQALEDISIMRSLPNMMVVVPCDAIEAKKATIALLKINKPSYIRLSREKIPVVTTEETEFEIGKAEIFREGSDATIIACGQMVYYAMQAAEQLAESHFKIRVVNLSTIKPIEQKVIIDSAEKTGAIVTVEEHQIMAGMGSAVAEVVVSNFPVPMVMVGIEDHFGESGTPNELLDKFGLSTEAIKKAVIKVLRMKTK